MNNNNNEGEKFNVQILSSLVKDVYVYKKNESNP